MRRFRLNSGIHSEGGKTYMPGDVFESASDLSVHNVRGDLPRYERVTTSIALSHGETPADRDPLGIHQLSVPELRQWADNEEIDLGDATRKSDILKTIENAYAPTVA
jgi:hypothetical protein